MPELAEVETVKRVLSKNILNKKIIDINVLYPKIIENDLNEFINKLKNKSIISINRLGKWLIFEIDEYYLLSHLRMEGKYYIKDSKLPIEKHEHVIFNLSDNTTLRYHDTRKFGRMKLVDKSTNIKELLNLGIDGNSDGLNEYYLYNKIHNKNIPIKTLLLDQSIISGLGNIYANEVLFASKLLPNRFGSNISIKECSSIVNNSKTILNKAIECGGTTIKSYTSSLGVIGHYQDYLMIHKQNNCKICNTKITKIKINGRSTYFCSKCQK